VATQQPAFNIVICQTCYLPKREGLALCAGHGEHDPVLTFFAPGTPVPQGSKKAWLNQKTHRVMMTED